MQFHGNKSSCEWRLTKCETSKAIVWELENLAPSCRLGQHQSQWETLLTYPPEPRAAELAAIKGKAVYTQPDLLWAHLEKQEFETLALIEGPGFEAEATLPSLSALQTV